MTAWVFEKPIARRNHYRTFLQETWKSRCLVQVDLPLMAMSQKKKKERKEIKKARVKT